MGVGSYGNTFDDSIIFHENISNEYNVRLTDYQVRRMHKMQNKA